MGRPRLYADNATRQRAYQEKLRRESLAAKLSQAQANAPQVQLKQSYEELVRRWLHGKSVPQAKAAYQSFLRIYKSIGQDFLFGGITKYLDERTPLAQGISLGEMEQFLESFDQPIECPICHYFRSGLEDNCPECELHVVDPKKYREYRKSLEFY
jgi:hypothetical protein